MSSCEKTELTEALEVEDALESVVSEDSDCVSEASGELKLTLLFSCLCLCLPSFFFKWSAVFSEIFLIIILYISE